MTPRLVAVALVLAAGCHSSSSSSSLPPAALDAAPGDAAVVVDGSWPDHPPVDRSAPPAPMPDAAARALDAAPDAPAPDAPAVGPPALPAVLTRGYDLQRTGANLLETVLTPAKITANGFGKLYCRDVDDEIYGQLLYHPALDLPGGDRRNVLFAVTVNDSAYAFDADDAAAPPLWEVHLADPDRGITPVPAADLGKTCGTYKDLSHAAGILSTPVIDPIAGTIYLLARTKENGSYVQRLHALSIRDGSERAGSPVTISARMGTGLNALTFDGRTQNQRAALLLAQGVVYLAWASHCDEGPYHGWILGYDGATLQQVVVYNTTPTGSEGGVWMAGQGPSVDDEGNIFLATGNGSADLDTPGPNRGQAVMKLRRQGATLEVLDWFTPFNYTVLETEDRDLGSSGALLVPGTDVVIGGGKEGKLYLLDRNNLGKHQSADDSQIFQTYSLTGELRAHLHGTPVHWRSTDGTFLYAMAEQDYLKQLRLTGHTVTLEKRSQIKAPFDPRADRYTMPGGILTLSASGDRPGTGIVWVTVPASRDANQAVVPGVLRAFDAGDVGVELWNSEENSARDSLGNFAKFNPVTVVNGRVYTPTFSNQYCVYGLLP